MWFVLKLDSADHALQSLAAKVELRFHIRVARIRYIPAKRQRNVCVKLQN